VELVGPGDVGVEIVFERMSQPTNKKFDQKLSVCFFKILFRSVMTLFGPLSLFVVSSLRLSLSLSIERQKNNKNRRSVSSNENVELLPPPLPR
jgi:hypothetical protein